jgi:hypothetical protein
MVRNWRNWTLVWLCLAVQSVLLVDAARRLSPTVDEPGHLTAGCSYWLTGNFDLYRVNPPLVKLLGAAGALCGVTLTDGSVAKLEEVVESERWPRERKNLVSGHEFLTANPPLAERGMFFARCACLPFCWIGGLICFFWASQLYGDRAGWIALLLWCGEPLILGHGCLLTMDVPCAATGVLAMYVFWHWLRRRTWTLSGLVGMTMGLALLTKFTWVILPALCVAFWGASSFGSEYWRPLGRQIGQIGVAVGVCLLVINLGYGFDRSGVPLGSYLFISEFLSGGLRGGGNPSWGTAWSAFPIPLPASWLSGLDVQKYDFEFPWRCYLDGAWKDGGWWYFYLLALAYKLPLGTLLLIAAATFGPLARTRPLDRRNELLPLLTGVAVIVVASLQTKFTLHARYVIPALPFLFIWCSRVLRGSASENPDSGNTIEPMIAGGMGPRLRALVACLRSVVTSRHRLFVTICCVWTIGSSLNAHPHQLSYFNELSRAPDGSYAPPPRLLDSNLDWGQDLLLLREWINRHAPDEPLYLAYFGYLDPSLFGIKFQPVPALHRERKKLPPGVYAVSVNYLFGHQFQCADGKGGFEFISSERVAPLREFTPVAYIGRSTWIYRIEPPDGDGDSH